MVAAVAGSPCSPSDFGKGEKFMQVLFLVLNRTEYLETLLERLLESGIHGCRRRAAATGKGKNRQRKAVSIFSTLTAIFPEC